MGGSIANNASGSHSILYGMSADHILAADVLLADGTAAHFELESTADIETRLPRLARSQPLLANIYNTALKIRREHVRATPCIQRSLKFFLPWNILPINLCVS